MLTKPKYKLHTEKAKSIRISKGYTLEQVARYLEKTRQTISLWENGLRNPGKSEIVLMARLYNVELGDIAFKESSDSNTMEKENFIEKREELKTLPPDIREAVLHLKNREKRLENERSYLRKENRRLKSIVNSVNSMIYTKDSKSNFMFVNDRYLEVLGITASRILGKNNHFIFNKRDADTLTSLEKAVLKSGSPIVKHQLKIPGINDLYGKISITPLYDSNEIISGISVNIEDNTLEKELDERRALLEEITSNLEEFIWIRSITPTKKLLYISRGAEDVLGYKLYELYNSYDIWHKNIEQKEVSTVKNWFNDKKSGQYNFKYTVNGKESSLRSPAFKTGNPNKKLSSHPVKVYNQEDKTIKWISYKKYVKKVDNTTIEYGIAQDITIKRGDQIRREMLEFVITNSPYGEWLEEIHPDGTIENIYFNKAMELNWGRPVNLLKRSSKFGWLKYLHPDDRKLRINEDINKTRTTPIQFRIIMPDKTVKWLEEVYFVKKTNRGTLLRCGHQWDITEAKNRELD